ncbi:MAG TPA: EFR1 family ferrodoxin [Smithellaceae bacterium]|nr:EFR1 family ferrodoxin [Smithellaceae bacterium]
MTTNIFYYTGTGNALWTARKIAQRLPDSQLTSICRVRMQNPAFDAPTIGLVFPVHIWGVPPPVVDFIEHGKFDSQAYIFAVAVNAGQVAATLLQLEKLLLSRRLRLSSGFSLDLPSNYIPWGGAITQEKQQKKFAAALHKMERIGQVVQNRQELLPDKGPFWQNILFTWIYRMSRPHVAGMDKSFLADEKCNKCGICEKICPAENIRIIQGKPTWQHACEQCFACIQWCPQEAIQYGKGTSPKKRYHHPEITLQDMIASSRNKS